MSDSSSWSFSLKREDIVLRKTRRDQLAEQIINLQRELEDEDRWFEAISLILPPAMRATLSSVLPSTEGNEPRSAWRRSIEPVITAATRGLLPREIAQGIRESDDEAGKDRLARNPNGLYAAIDRMIDDGQLVRHGDRLYTTALYDALSRNGDLDDDADDNALTGVNSFIYNLINLHGPMPPKTIMEALRGSEDFQAKIAKNPQYGYSAIARLVRQGHLAKDGGNYRLPSQKNEPRGAGASHGSDAGSADIFG